MTQTPPPFRPSGPPPLPTNPPRQDPGLPPPFVERPSAVEPAVSPPTPPSPPSRPIRPAKQEGPPVNERVANLVNDVIRFTSTVGKDHLGQRLRDEAGRWRNKETTIVVAGEPNRGKSALINALLSSDVALSSSTRATGAYVVLRYGAAPATWVIRDGAQPVPVDPGQVDSLVAAGADEGVDGIVIESPSEFLADGLVLIDTPGVGSLSQAQGRMTLAALARADALLFVLDPAEPLSRPELTFLAAASERIERVVFAIARTDRYPGWSIIGEDDRALLEHHAPDLAGAPILATSARLARLAEADVQQPDLELLNDSGLPELRSQLVDGVGARIAAVRLANLLRLTASTLSDVQVPLEQSVVAAAGSSGARAVAEEEQQSLDRLREAAERLQVEVTDRFNALRESAGTDFTRLIREISSGFDGEAAAAAPQAEALVEQINAEVRAGCAELSLRLDEEIASIADEVSAVLGDLNLGPLSLQLTTDVFAPTGDVDDTGPADPMLKMRVASALASSGTGVAMAANYASSNPVLAALMGTGAIMAVTMAALNVRGVVKQRDVAGARKQVQATLEAARSEVSPILRQQILSAQRELERVMKSAIRQQTKDHQARIAEATQLARADAAERAAAKSEAERQLAVMAPLTQRNEALRAEVTDYLYED